MSAYLASTYRASDRFRGIEEHECVADVSTGELVAVTGPISDAESKRVARLFAASPDLLRACENALRDWPVQYVDGFPRLTATDSARINELRSAIRKAQVGA